jgi:tetratricopeptide (TPR) repeat protein
MKRIITLLAIITGSISFSQDLDSLNQRIIDKEYNNRIELGDSLFEAKEFSKAKEAYSLALEIKPSESYPKGQNDYIQRNADVVFGTQYEKMINKADEYFEARDYEKAKSLYGMSIKLMSHRNNPYPENRIIEINKIVESQILQDTVPREKRDIGDVDFYFK